MKKSELLEKLAQEEAVVHVNEHMRFSYGKLKRGGTTYSYKIVINNDDFKITKAQFDSIRNLLGPNLTGLLGHKEYKVIKL